uniref:Uncharacterized protein n=1 Tax=Glossina brevipalpis TaxID=37001 RepID=A0A1A9W3C0_9MUSC
MPASPTAMALKCTPAGASIGCQALPIEILTILFYIFVASQPLAGVGGLTSSQASPAKFSRVTPERTMTRPLYKTAQTNPVGPTLNCVSSLPAGVEMAVQRKPSGEELLTPKKTIFIFIALKWFEYEDEIKHLWSQL